MRGRFVPSSCIRAMPSPHTAGVKVALRRGARIVIRHPLVVRRVVKELGT